VHLALLAALLAAAVFADGGTIAEVWLACEFAAGLLVISWAAAGKRPRAASPRAETLPLAVLAVPLYATVQAIPLPLDLVRVLSPARAELHERVSSWMPGGPSWTALSVHPEATLDFALRLAAYAAVYWLVRGLGERFRGNGFAVAAPIVLVAAAQSAVALLQDLAAEPATGSYINRNHLAGLLEMALPFAVMPLVSPFLAAARGWLSGESRRGSAAAVWNAPAGVAAVWTAPAGSAAVWTAPARSAAVWNALAGSAAVLIFAAILATGSRGGLIATLVSLLVAGLAALQRITLPRKKWLLAAMAPALCAVAFLYLPSDKLVRRYANVLGGEALRREGRVLLWSETLDLVAAYPLVGCGFGGFEPAFLRYKRSAPMVADTHAHNDYLELLAEAGVIGFALCLLLAARPVATALRASLRGEPSPDSDVALACVASLAAILAHSLVDFNLRIPANGMVFFWLLGMCRACGDALEPTRSGG
jgi:O-antigen ligase